MKTLLICGGTGFIGSNLVRHFSLNKEFHLKATYFNTIPKFKSSNLEWVHCDLRNYNEAKMLINDVDIILQYAATTSGVKDIVNSPHIHICDNAIINSILLRLSYESGVKHFIFPSCTVMYNSSENLLREIDYNPSVNILSSYYGIGHTKLYIEKMCKFYSEISQSKYTVLRQSNIYGAYDKYNKEKSHVFAASISKVMQAKNNTIEVWGTGKEARDFLHVDDLCRCIDLVLNNQSNSFELFNVGLGTFTKIEDLVTKIIEYSGKDLSISFDKSKPTIHTSIALDTSYARKVLGWRPLISLADGIKLTILWYKNYFSI